MNEDDRRLLQALLEVALRLIAEDEANADKHLQIAESLLKSGRRKFGPRFGDNEIELWGEDNEWW